MAIHHPFDINTYHQEYINVSNPAAGSPIDYVLPDNIAAEVTYLEFQYTADATAGTRYVRLDRTDKDGNIISTMVRFAQAPSASRKYSLYAGTTPNVTTIDLAGQLSQSIGLDIRMPWCKHITVTATAIAAADQFATIYLAYKVWPMLVTS